MHAGKTKVLMSPTRGDVDMKRTLPTASGVFLGVPMRTDAVGHGFDTAIVK